MTDLQSQLDESKQQSEAKLAGARGKATARYWVILNRHATPADGDVDAILKLLGVLSKSADDLGRDMEEIAAYHKAVALAATVLELDKKHDAACTADREAKQKLAVIPKELEEAASAAAVELRAVEGRWDNARRAAKSLPKLRVDLAKRGMPAEILGMGKSIEAV